MEFRLKYRSKKNLPLEFRFHEASIGDAIKQVHNLLTNPGGVFSDPPVRVIKLEKVEYTEISFPNPEDN